MVTTNFVSLLDPCLTTSYECGIEHVQGNKFTVTFLKKIHRYESRKGEYQDQNIQQNQTPGHVRDVKFSCFLFNNGMTIFDHHLP